MKKTLLILICLSVVILGNLLARTPDREIQRRQYRVKKRMAQAINRLEPEVVMIGNSMLTEGCDPRWFTQLTGARTIQLARGGSASAWWYLVMKNIVAGQDHKPKMAAIFFRDAFLTRPAFRTTGRYQPIVDAMATSSEPVLQKLAYRNHMNPAYYLLFRISPLLQKNETYTSSWRLNIKDDLVGRLFSLEPKAVDRSIKRLFAPDQMIRQQMTARQLDVEKRKPGRSIDFAMQVERSFLPHIIQIAKESGIHLTLIRVKRRRDTAPGREDAQLRQYMADLKAYARRHRIDLVDFTHDPRLALSDFAEGDHLSREQGRIVFTRMVAEALTPIIHRHR